MLSYGHSTMQDAAVPVEDETPPQPRPSLRTEPPSINKIDPSLTTSLSVFNDHALGVVP
jgi:hypothetical protein